MLHIILNPASGDRSSESFVDETVLPLLTALSIPHEIHRTSSPADVPRLGRHLHSLITPGADKPLQCAIVGGDGTAHELIEGIWEEAKDRGLGRWELAILPLGTANALFWSLFPSSRPPSVPAHLEPFLKHLPAETLHKLSSLLLLLSGSSSPLPLLITLTTLLPPLTSSSSSASASASPLTIPSHVVASTSLHAALLDTSETLRAAHPGLERFKLAAAQNLGVFFPASLSLLGPSPKQYDPKTQSFVHPFTTSSSTERYTLEGPFSYVLSTTTCSHLEPQFCISPLLRRLPPSPPGQTMDIIVMRPMRDPRVREVQDAAAAEEWKKRALEVTGLAYSGGGHVDLTFEESGEEGEVVVEVFRCKGFEWVPGREREGDGDEKKEEGEEETEAEAKARLVCCDGSIYRVPRGGKARVEVMRPATTVAAAAADEGFFVWA